MHIDAVGAVKRAIDLSTTTYRARGSRAPSRHFPPVGTERLFQLELHSRAPALSPWIVHIQVVYATVICCDAQQQQQACTMAFPPLLT